MKTNKKLKLSLSEIIFYICSFLMVFSVFMFFMSPLKFTYNKFADVSSPSFFDLIFGNKWSVGTVEWPVISGIVFMFIFQIILIGTCLTISCLLILRKIKKHTAVCILIGVATLALICGILVFCSNLMISRKYVFPDYSELIPLKYDGLMKLNYGAYVYGITMILAALGSVGAFVLDHYNK